jgi:hypothetical protein
MLLPMLIQVDEIIEQSGWLHAPVAHTTDVAPA